MKRLLQIIFVCLSINLSTEVKADGDPSAQAKVRSAEDGEAAALARVAPSLDGPGVSPDFEKEKCLPRPTRHLNRERLTGELTVRARMRLTPQVLRHKGK